MWHRIDCHIARVLSVVLSKRVLFNARPFFSRAQFVKTKAKCYATIREPIFYLTKITRATEALETL